MREQTKFSDSFEFKISVIGSVKTINQIYIYSSNFQKFIFQILLVKFGISAFAWFVDEKFHHRRSGNCKTNANVQMPLHEGSMMAFQLWTRAATGCWGVRGHSIAGHLRTIEKHLIE